MELNARPDQRFQLSDDIMTESHLIIRADANTEIGTGHVMRCLSLAQAWQNAGGFVTFVMCCEAPAIESKLTFEGMAIVHLSMQRGSLEDARATVKIAKKESSSWVVLDGYKFGSGYQKLIKDAGLRLLCIDDNGDEGRYYADIVLNQNLHAHEGLYANRESYTKLLLGTKYTLLRREFWKWKGKRRGVSKKVHTVLVTMGGADQNNVSLKVINALQMLDGLESVVIIGGSNPNYGALQSAVKDSHCSIHLERNAQNMPELMSWADLAISSGGTTVWELAFMGLPQLLLILADNQVNLAEHMEQMGYAVNLGWHNDISAEEISRAVMWISENASKRTEMIMRCRELVDGEGVNRVMMYLNEEKLRIRKASKEDCGLIWKWANDPETRRASFSSGPISWEEHVKWFFNKLQDPNCFFFMALDIHDDAIGSVRFDLADNMATINVNIRPDLRRAGYGMSLIKKSVELLRIDEGVKSMHAFIKPNNDASINLFEKLRFKHIGVETVKGCPALHYVMDK